MKNKLALLAMAAAVFVSGYSMGRADSRGRVYELRTYTTNEGKLDALLERFRSHTTRLFEKHGMTNVGYWVPQDEPKSKNTLIYLLAHKDREAAKKNWDEFRADPEWKKVQTASETGGKIVDHLESVFMDPTDFSKLK